MLDEGSSKKAVQQGGNSRRCPNGKTEPTPRLRAENLRSKKVSKKKRRRLPRGNLRDGSGIGGEENVARGRPRVFLKSKRSMICKKEDPDGRRTSGHPSQSLENINVKVAYKSQDALGDTTGRY